YTPSGTPEQPQDCKHHTTLLVIHSMVLFSGTISLSLMMYMMKSSITSSTSIAVLNLIFTHFIYLLTVPFRIYYHAVERWSLGSDWCRVVSSMIHIHMYMSFLFYVIILVSRLVTFYRRAEREVSFKRGHAVIVSVVVWVLVLLVIPCIIYFYYGKMNSNRQNTKHCFDFGGHIRSAGKVFNYLICILVILVSLALVALQANAVRVLYRKHQRSCTFQHDFGAHLKSLCFAAIMTICFVPYHVFRLIYLEHLELQNVNEVFLSLTTFNCLDMLTFL
uniref:G protein-coupled receptor 141 n=1 Tax=Tetraodon nigroviridis TaxID=99883 RepID=H3CRR8_TETNG